MKIKMQMPPTSESKECKSLKKGDNLNAFESEVKEENKMHKGENKPKNLKATAKRLLSIVGGFSKFKLCMVCLCIIFSSLAGVIGSMFVKTVIDEYITPLLAQSNPVFTQLAIAVSFMAGIYAVGVLSSFIYTRLMVGIAQGVLKDIRDTMFFKMQTFPIRYFDTNSNGDIMSRYTNDTDALLQMIAEGFPQIFNSLITIIVVFVAMMITSVYLTMVVIFVVILMMFVGKVIGGKSAKFYIEQQKEIGKTNGFIEEMINGQKVIKVFCHEEKAKEGFDELNNILCEKSTIANKFANTLMPIMGNIGNLQYVLLAIVGGVLALNNIGGVTLGAIAAFLMLSRAFTMPIMQVAQQINMVAMALAGAERIFSLMDEKPEEDNGYVTLVNAKIENGELIPTQESTGIWAWQHPHGDGTVTYTRLNGNVEFDNVDFGYVEGKLILKDVSLFAHSGQKIAFVGSTGAGKTTITNLINRFYDINDGKIRYDGININKIKKHDLRRSLGIVLQETNLFTGTVRDNIRFGKLDATEEEIISASKLANAHDFIERLPNGYDTLLQSDGANLSQGQRQLLSIARAAVANAPVMILDEATSSIDTRTELLVQQGTNKLMEGRTVFIIAHRLSTIKNADVIMVMEHGEIIESGNHDELIAKGGKYFQLYNGSIELS